MNILGVLFRVFILGGLCFRAAISYALCEDIYPDTDEGYKAKREPEAAAEAVLVASRKVNDGFLAIGRLLLLCGSEKITGDLILYHEVDKIIAIYKVNDKPTCRPMDQCAPLSPTMELNVI